MEPFSPEEREVFLTLLQRLGAQAVSLAETGNAPPPPV